MTTTLTGRIGGSSAIAEPLTDVEAIEALSGTGIAARTAPNTWALRTLTAPAAGLGVSNGDGVSGNPTLALANDLAALEALSSTGIAVRTASDTWAQRSLAVSGTGLAVSNADGSSGNPTVTITPSSVLGAVVAAQSDQETASSTSVAVTPGRQQYHPSAAKCWANVTVSSGTPTLQSNYNITSITDTATGKLTVTIGADFSSANWSAHLSVELTGSYDNSHEFIPGIQHGSIAAGSIVLECYDNAGGYIDPSSWHFVGYGDQ